MSFYLVTAFNPQVCERITTIFKSLGIRTQNSLPESHLAADDLCRKMLVSRQTQNNFDPVSIKQIGQAWKVQASEIIIRNADITPWYWTSTHALALLDFWRSLESEARMILVYVSPVHALNFCCEHASQYKDADGLELSSYVQDWYEYHNNLLRFYTENQDACILVNAEQLVEKPDELASLLNQKFGTRIPQSFDVPSSPLAIPGFMELVAVGILNDSHEVKSLFSEMDNLADLTKEKEVSNLSNKEKAWVEFVELNTEIENLKEEREKLLENEETAKQEINLLTSQLQTTQEELEHQFTELSKVRDEKAKLVENDEITKRETELLTLQLQQVQRELEKVFDDTSRSNGKVEKVPKTEAIDNRSAKSAVTIDLREYVVGSNWHEAEQDGRWTGPGNHTTLQLPDLSPGRYVLQFTIISSLARPIFDGVKVQIDDKDLNCNVKYKANLKGLFAPIRRARAKIQKKIFPYPAEFSARIHITDTQNSNPPTLKISTPETMSPEVFGSGDKRLLGVKISSLTIKPE